MTSSEFLRLDFIGVTTPLFVMSDYFACLFIYSWFRLSRLWLELVVKETDLLDSELLCLLEAFDA